MKAIFNSTYNRFKDIVIRQSNKNWYKVKGKKFKLFKYRYGLNTSEIPELNHLVVTDILNRDNKRHQYSILNGTGDRIKNISVTNNTISISCKINNSNIFYNKKLNFLLQNFLNNSICEESLNYYICGDEIVFTIPVIDKFLTKVKYIKNIMINGYITMSPNNDTIEELLLTVEHYKIDSAYASDILYAYLYSKK